MEKSVTYSPVNTDYTSVFTIRSANISERKKIFDEISAPQKKKRKKKDLIQYTFKLHSFTFNINIKVKRASASFGTCGILIKMSSSC